MKVTPSAIQFAQLKNLKDLKIITYNTDASYPNLLVGVVKEEKLSFFFLLMKKMTTCLLT